MSSLPGQDSATAGQLSGLPVDTNIMDGIWIETVLPKPRRYRGR